MDQVIVFFKDPIVLKLTYIVVGGLIIFLILRLVKSGLNKYIPDNSAKYKARKFLNFLAYFIFIILIITIFNYKLSSFGVALGVAGAGIAFALQEVIVSVAGYLAIITGRYFETGNRVQMGGVKGDVIDIGLIRTTIMQTGDWIQGDLYNGKIVKVANSFLFKEPVYNYSGDFPFLWDEMTVPIKTTSDFKLAKELILDILKDEVGDYANNSKDAWKKMTDEYKIEQAVLDPMVHLQFNENWITLTLRFIVDYKSRRGTKDKISTRILEEFNKHGDRIQVASAAMEITAFPAK